MTGIRPVAKMNAIKKAVDITPGCACVSVTEQADYFIVHLTEFGGSRVIRVDDAAHALRILNRTQPETEQ